MTKENLTVTVRTKKSKKLDVSILCSPNIVIRMVTLNYASD